MAVASFAALALVDGSDFVALRSTGDFCLIESGAAGGGVTAWNGFGMKASQRLVGGAATGVATGATAVAGLDAAGAAAVRCPGALSH